MSNSLANQKVLIIGGSGRMGLVTAQLAAKQGASVILCGRSIQGLEEAASTIEADIEILAGDFTSAEDAERLLQGIAPLDHIVVASAGGASAGSIVETPSSAAQAAFGRFWASYHALHFAPRVLPPTGTVTLLSGSSGRRPMAGVGVWGALHGSIEALARSAALEVAPIRVNVVSPGGIGMRSDRQLAHHAGRAEDVAAMIVALWLNPAITNAVIDVDGGERLGTWP